MSDPCTTSRRSFLGRAAATVAGMGLGAAGCVGGAGMTRDGLRIVDLQLGWLAGANQLGEIVAARLGFFEQEGLAFRLHAGGPNIDGVAIVASGRYAVGAATSSPSVMLAVAQGIPIRCFAVAMQEHPYAYFSLPANPVRVADDLRGKTVGIQPTGRVLLDALLARHAIPHDALEIQVIGSSLVPLLTGQVDVISGWTTNAASLRPLEGREITMRLWDAGIRLYAWPYYATTRLIDEEPEVLTGFLRAAARGWQTARQEPERAVEMLVEQLPVLRYEDELLAARRQMPYVFNEQTAAAGWGTMSRDTWGAQLDTYARLDQFARGAPRLDDIFTTEILEATAGARGPGGPA